MSSTVMSRPWRTGLMAVIGLDCVVAHLPRPLHAQASNEAKLAEYDRLLRTPDSTRLDQWLALFQQGVTLAQMRRFDEALASIRAFERLSPRVTVPGNLRDRLAALPFAAISATAIVEAERGDIEASVRELQRLQRAVADTIDGRMLQLTDQKAAAAARAWDERARQLEEWLAASEPDSLKRRARVRDAMGPRPNVTRTPFGPNFHVFVRLGAGGMATAERQIGRSASGIGLDLLARSDARGIDWLLWSVNADEPTCVAADDPGRCFDELRDALGNHVRAGRISLPALRRRIVQQVGEPGSGRSREPAASSNSYVDATAFVAASLRRTGGQLLWAGSAAQNHTERSLALAAVALRADTDALGFGAGGAFHELLRHDLGLRAPGEYALCSPGQPGLRIELDADDAGVSLKIPISGGFRTTTGPTYYDPVRRVLKATDELSPNRLGGGPNRDTWSLAGVLANGGTLTGAYTWRLCGR